MPEGDWFCAFCTHQMSRDEPKATGDAGDVAGDAAGPERSSTPLPAEQTTVAAAPPPATTPAPAHSTQVPEPLAAATTATAAATNAANTATPQPPLPPPVGAVPDPVLDPTVLSVKELRDALRARGVDYTGCIEKSELVTLLQRVAH